MNNVSLDRQTDILARSMGSHGIATNNTDDTKSLEYTEMV